MENEEGESASVLYSHKVGWERKERGDIGLKDSSFKWRGDLDMWINWGIGFGGGAEGEVGDPAVRRHKGRVRALRD